MSTKLIENQVNRSIKSAIRTRFPSTRIIKAWWVAIRDTVLPVRDSYSQTGEDQLIGKLIDRLGIDSRVYVDVGANHPSRLSNTFRLYRSGFRGVVIEPNRSLMRLHRCFRPKDRHLRIGCGEQPSVLSFQHASSHVLSGFKSEGLKAKSIKDTEYIPVLPLDLVLESMDFPEIAVLSVDAEGFDLQVVWGAKETLKKTSIVVIEGNESDAQLMNTFLEAGFKLEGKTIHNLIFVRS